MYSDRRCFEAATALAIAAMAEYRKKERMIRCFAAIKLSTTTGAEDLMGVAGLRTVPFDSRGRLLNQLLHRRCVSTMDSGNPEVLKRLQRIRVF